MGAKGQLDMTLGVIFSLNCLPLRQDACDKRCAEAGREFGAEDGCDAELKSQSQIDAYFMSPAAGCRPVTL